MFDVTSVVEAISIVFSFEVLMWVCIGVALGLGVGAIPGLTGTTAIALALPLTFAMPLADVIALLIGIYKGVMFGGSISAITFATPGTPDAAALIDDGHALMRKGQGRKALQVSLYSSVTSDVVSDLLTILIAPLFAIAALSFGPSERFWLMMLAISVLGALTGNHLAKGMLSAAIGLFLASIGSDPISSISRNTFGQWWLSGGVGLIPLVIGLFAMARVIEQSIPMIVCQERVQNVLKAIREGQAVAGENLTFKEYISCWRQMGVGFVIGCFVGILPGLGSSVATFLSFGVCKKMFPNAKIGTGRIEGLAAVESANSATVGPALVPLLTFGIPGGSIVAMIGAALSLKGVTPGPQMFDLFPVAIYTLFVVLLVANVANLIIGRFLCEGYARLGQLPNQILLPAIAALAVLGAWSYANNPYDVYVMLGFGVMGYLMRLVKIPEAPLIITFLLAPLAESNIRRAALINNGDWVEALFSSSLSIALIIAMAVLIIFFTRSGRPFKSPKGADQSKDSSDGAAQDAGASS